MQKEHILIDTIVICAVYKFYRNMEYRLVADRKENSNKMNNTCMRLSRRNKRYSTYTLTYNDDTLASTVVFVRGV